MCVNNIPPAVSVIVPIYNSEAYLSKCLDSLVNQTLQDVEFILINDGSTDGSNTIISKYLEQDYRFSLIEQENSGVGSARNHGIKKAKGKYISFVDSDDNIEPKMLEDLYSHACLENLDIVTCRYKKVDNDNKVLQEGPDYHNFDKEIMFKNLITLNIPSVCWNSLYNKSLFLQPDCLFPHNDMYNEDTATLYKLFFYANSVGFINSFYYNWHFTPHSKTNSISTKHIDDMYQIVLSIKEFLVKQTIYPLYKYEFICSYFKALLKKRFQILHFSDEQKQKKYLEYLINLFTSEHLIDYNEDMKEFRNIYPGIYFEILLLLKQIPHENNLLLNSFYKDDYDIIENLISRNCGLEQILFDHISTLNIKELYIYGTGSILNSFLKTHNNKIKIIEIFDRESKTLNQFYPPINVKSLTETAIKENSYIVIFSLTSAKEITQRVQKYSEENMLNLKIINFYNCISL